MVPNRRPGQVVIGCRRIQQGLPQGLHGNNLCQCTEAARFLAVPCGRVHSPAPEKCLDAAFNFSVVVGLVH
jgi:hypothetical protein